MARGRIVLLSLLSVLLLCCASVDAKSMAQRRAERRTARSDAAAKSQLDEDADAASPEFPTFLIDALTALATSRSPWLAVPRCVVGAQHGGSSSGAIRKTPNNLIRRVATVSSSTRTQVRRRAARRARRRARRRRPHDAALAAAAAAERDRRARKQGQRHVLFFHVPARWEMSCLQHSAGSEEKRTKKDATSPAGAARLRRPARLPLARRGERGEPFMLFKWRSCKGNKR